MKKGDQTLCHGKGVPKPVQGLGDSNQGKGGPKHYVMERGTRPGRRTGVPAVREGAPDITSWERGTRPGTGTGRPVVKEKGDQTLRYGKGYQTR